MASKHLFFLFSFLLLCHCHSPRQEKEAEAPAGMDLPQLRDSGEITAVTLYGSTSYFQYKMQPMGYEYDLVKDFARSLA